MHRVLELNALCYKELYLVMSYQAWFYTRTLTSCWKLIHDSMLQSPLRTGCAWRRSARTSSSLREVRSEVLFVEGWWWPLVVLAYGEITNGKPISKQLISKLQVETYAAHDLEVVTGYQRPLGLVMLRLCIDGLICKLANYIFINFKISYLRAQWSDFDELYINIIMGTSGFDLYG